MDNLYLPLKHSHMMFVVISVILFQFRAIKLMMKPYTSFGKIWKIAPHINDTLLLITGASLFYMGNWSVLGWAGLKLGLVIGYILLGIRCLKNAPRSAVFWQSYVGATLVLVAIVYLARFKPF
ncbi:SirB2 family protein [Alysiella filiformis]|uniref:Uncharacterized membrane protein SirB2 n=1 Tax=Alysiella filiformis DSM 16848 TaxID=1120981 RepID=A0A286EAQ3_9NEIS|nr:SirB2 family protein [Alysiella filiformis]QMT32271.1 SirB2 family protein [Alysiella filiformis]UBQ56808.1 SirB2 family protein [Alysiella filiformis DSM 16848]SOD67983.1 Uncharacterized membrane protein SirB2 [Alysiella filiformis DSM 16848]